MRQRRKPWAIPYLEKSPIVKKIDDKNLEIIETPPKFELEIGLGKGDFINAKAINNPHIFYIGIEAQASVLVSAVMKAEKANLKNIKFILGNAVHTKNILPPESASIIYINFPDPWPKARHEKRRLLYKDMLNNFYQVLDKNGLLLLKTDNLGLYEYALVSLAENRYIIIDNTNDYQVEKDDYPTEYETRFRNMGNPIYRIKARKV